MTSRDVLFLTQNYPAMTKHKPYVFSFVDECLLFKTNNAFFVVLGLFVYGLILLALFPMLFMWLIFMPSFNLSIPQIGIVFFGASAIWLVGRKDKWQKWGYIVGLFGQPFWYWTAISLGQWGLFIITSLYTLSWLRGVYNYWIKPHRNGKHQSAL